MRILFALPYVPSVVRVRSYELVRSLLARGHTIRVAAPSTGASDDAAATRLRDAGVDVDTVSLSTPCTAWNALRAVTSGVPIQTRFALVPALGRRIAERIAAEPIDVVHVEHVRGARYGLDVRAEDPSVPIVWDAVDAIHPLFEQAAHHAPSRRWRTVARFERARTEALEADLIGRFDDVLVTSEVDRRALVSLRPDLAAFLEERLHVLPNGVDTHRFRPREASERVDAGGADADSAGADVVFTGKMSYHANAAAAIRLLTDILPRVWQERPDVTAAIVGQRPPEAVRALAARYSGRVRVTGFVPDMAAVLTRARLAVVPLSYGAGIQNKILEALACGVPVVASPLAAAGLGPARGTGPVLVARDDDAFARSVLSLLSDDARRIRLGTEGRAYVTRYHGWCDVAARLESIYEAGRRRASTASNTSSAAPPRVTKRPAKVLLDYTLGTLTLALALPLLLALALLVRLDSPGPSFHRRRVLRAGGGVFDAFKLRTMHVDGARILSEHPDLAERLSAHHKLRDDPRVTRVGRWLRRWSLDELPQLVNVLRGDMSLVGPRMISPEELVRYGSTGRLLLTVKPGITGLWQVSGRSDVSFEERIRLDRTYIEHYSLARDLRILFVDTPPAVLRRRGAY